MGDINLEHSTFQVELQTHLGTPPIKQALRSNQVLGAWTPDCCFTEALGRVAKVTNSVEYSGVSNTTFAKTEIGRPPDVFIALNDDGEEQRV